MSLIEVRSAPPTTCDGGFKDKERTMETSISLYPFTDFVPVEKRCSSENNSVRLPFNFGRARQEMIIS